jgi:hypothetical protein
LCLAKPDAGENPKQGVDRCKKNKGCVVCFGKVREVRKKRKGAHNLERKVKQIQLCKEKRVEMLRMGGIGNGGTCEGLQRMSVKYQLLEAATEPGLQLSQRYGR